MTVRTRYQSTRQFVALITVISLLGPSLQVVPAQAPAAGKPATADLTAKK